MSEVKFTYNDNGNFWDTLIIDWWGKPVTVYVSDHMEAEVMANRFMVKQVAKVNAMREAYDKFHEAGMIERNYNSKTKKS